MSTVQDNKNIFKQFLRKHPRWKEKITCSVLLIVSLRILLVDCDCDVQCDDWDNWILINKRLKKK